MVTQPSECYRGHAARHMSLGGVGRGARRTDCRPSTDELELSPVVARGLRYPKLRNTHCTLGEFAFRRRTLCPCPNRAARGLQNRDKTFAFSFRRTSNGQSDKSFARRFSWSLVLRFADRLSTPGKLSARPKDESRAELPESGILRSCAGRHFVDEAEPVDVQSLVTKSRISETMVAAGTAAMVEDDSFWLSKGLEVGDIAQSSLWEAKGETDTGEGTLPKRFPTN